MSSDVNEVGNLQTIAASRDDVVNNAEKNLNFFAAIAIAEIFRFNYPPIFLAIWQILTQAAHITRGKTKLAIGIPRGFAKTTFLKLFVVWLILFTNRRFVLVICNTQSLAENFLSDVVDILSSINICGIFGRWNNTVEKDTLNQKKFHFRGRDIILASAGAGTSIRGLNIKFVRPDVILMDDMQSREQAESVVESVKVLTWMLGTLMKASSPERCLYIFVGNMYPFEGSILRKLKYNSAWVSFITAAILEDGQSIWQELKPVEELITELEDDTSMGHAEIFYSEVMNDEEAGTKSGVDISQIVGVPRESLAEYPEAGFIIIDPSGSTKKSDDMAMGAVLVYTGVPYLVELKTGKFTPQETIQKALALALKYGISAIVIEGVNYQASLAYWFQFFIEKLGIKGVIPLLVYPGSGNTKVTRILTMFKMLLKRPEPELKIVSEVRSQVVYQITHFNPLKPRANKDDILDILAYISIIMAQHRAQLAIMNLLDEKEDRDIRTADEDTLEIAF